MSILTPVLSRRACLIALLFASFALTVPGQAAPAAQTVPTEPRVTLNVSYGTAGGHPLLLDVFEPQGFFGKRPGVVLVHGGGWSGGDKDFYRPLGMALARQGYVAFSVNYRLSGVAHYPAQVDDVQRAVRWVRFKSDAYGIDPTRIGALGDSAGGHLVTILGTRDTRDNSDPALAAYSSRVQCVVDFYGPSDLSTIADLEPPTDASRYGAQAVHDFLGVSAWENPALHRDASPLFSVNAQSAPMLIIQGQADPLVRPDQSEKLYDALRAAKVEATLALMYQQGHGFLDPGHPQTYGGMISEFFARHLKP